MRLKQTTETETGLDRRALLRRAGIGAGLVGIGWAFGREGREDEVRAARFHGGDILGRGDAHPAWYRLKVIGQPVMDAQVMFLLGLATAGLTDVGEVLDTATRIVPGSEASWFEQWCATADRVHRYGYEAEARGHHQSAASHWYRAGAYYRAALMRYAKRDDPRIVRATRVSLALHDQALARMGYDSHEVAIPHGAGTLHGRVHYAGEEQAPVLVLHQGMHAWPEDTMWVVDGALRRGYHVLSFHGPGQGASLRLGGHVFRPDWEVAVGDVLDFAAADDRFDMERTILMGLSFGGYLAPRAAAFDDRVRALVVDPGVVSWADSTMRHFESMPGLLDLHAAGPSAFDRAIDIAGAAMPDARWYFEDATWKHGVGTPHELVDELRRYGDAAHVGRIGCKTLVIEGTAEDASPGEGRRFYDALSAPKTWLELDDSTASQPHCQGGNQLLVQARLFDWLDEEVGS